MPSREIDGVGHSHDHNFSKTDDVGPNHVFGFFKSANPGLFFYFRSLQTRILQKKTVGFIGIWTQMVRVECEHGDH